MKKFISILLALTIVMPMFAQRYIVDAVGTPHTLATTDAYKGKRDFLSQSSHEASKQTGSTVEKVMEIPNGTVVSLNSLGTVFKTKSNKKLQAEITYEGNTWYVWARDLVFSPDNAVGVKDALEGIDFSPRHFKLNYKDENGEKTYRFINVVDVHSEEGHRLYSFYYPTRVLLLIGATFVLLLLALLARKKRPIRMLVIAIVPLLMVATVVIEGYCIFRMGSDSMWFINPELFAKKTCVLRSIPLIATFALQCFSMVLYFRLLPTRTGESLNGFSGLVSTLIGFIPAVVIGYFIAKGITGFNDATATVADSARAWSILGISAFALLLIFPIINYTSSINTGNRFTSLIAGIATAIFVVIFWIGAALLLIMIIYALVKLFLYIIAQVFMWVVLFAFCGSKFGSMVFQGGGGGGGSGSGNNREEMVWRDKEGGIHTNGVDAQIANERIDAAREAKNL